MTIKSSLTILFENPFWIGLYERIDGDRYEISKISFGAEPKDYEVYDFLLKNWDKLRFSPFVKTDNIEERKINPKRMKREINKQLENKGIGTKAQQALKFHPVPMPIKTRCFFIKKLKCDAEQSGTYERQKNTIPRIMSTKLFHTFYRFILTSKKMML